MSEHFKIGSTSFKSPSEFKIERYNVTNLERLANADMTGDLIAKKKKFYFTYAAITGEDLDNILDLIDGNTIFFDLTYPYQGTNHTVKVYAGSIPQELHRAGLGTDWVWKNVTFNLIQK